MVDGGGGLLTIEPLYKMNQPVMVTNTTVIPGNSQREEYGKTLPFRLERNLVSFVSAPPLIVQ